MFQYIVKKVRYAQLKAINNESLEQQTETAGNKTNSELISPDSKINIDKILKIMSNSDDVIIREFDFGYEKQIKGALIYISGMTNTDLIQENILQPLMHDTQMIPQNKTVDFTNTNIIKQKFVSVGRIKEVKLLSDIIDSLLTGSTILLIDGSKVALDIPAEKYETRSVSEPPTESVVRGSREGFIEDIRVNKALIRRKIKDPDLCFESFKIGDKSRTIVCIVYLKSIASSKMIEEVRIRLKRIKIDAILESGYVEAFIEDAPYSIFPTVGNSEKPDKVAARLLEGRVAILVDGTPFVLVVPLLFIENFQSSEDYYSRPFLASFIRMLRFVAYILSILAPAIYVALTVYHQELIPTQLLISFASGRQMVPFPAVMEALMMMFTFDILREAGVRLPKPVGSAVSIVGALVLGQSAVAAGLVSPIMVIVVAATAISSFVVPAQTDSCTLLRYTFLILAGVAGGFGIMMGGLIVVCHLASLRSYGMPYFSPLAPLSVTGLKDTFIRLPLWSMIRRPTMLGQHNPVRQASPSAPHPEKKKTVPPKKSQGGSDEKK